MGSVGDRNVTLGLYCVKLIGSGWGVVLLVVPVGSGANGREVFFVVGERGRGDRKQKEDI